MYDVDFFWIIMMVFIVTAIIVQIVLDRKKNGQKKK